MPLLARFVSRTTIAGFLLAGLVACPALAQSWEDKLVKPGSPAMQAVYAQPLAADPDALLVALEKLRYAGDKPHADALQRHLAQRALAALAGRTLDTRGTIGDLVARPPPDAAAGVKAILHSTFTARLVRVEGIELVLAVTNASGHPVERYDAFASVPRPDHDPVVLQCEPDPPTRAVFAPGEMRTHRCEVRGNRAFVDEYFASIAGSPDAVPVAMESIQLRFADPPVYVSRMGAGWHGTYDGPRSEAVLAMRKLDCTQRGACAEESAAAEQARAADAKLAADAMKLPGPAPDAEESNAKAEAAVKPMSPSADPRSDALLAMRSLDCRQRGACGEELRAKFFSFPNVFFLLAVGAGLLAGGIVGLGRRAGRNAVVAALVFVVLGGWAAVAGPGALGVGGYAALGLFVLAVALLATFVTTFLIAVWIAGFFRRAERTTPRGAAIAGAPRGDGGTTGNRRT